VDYFDPDNFLVTLRSIDKFYASSNIGKDLKAKSLESWEKSGLKITVKV